MNFSELVDKLNSLSESCMCENESDELSIHDVPECFLWDLKSHLLQYKKHGLKIRNLKFYKEDNNIIAKYTTILGNSKKHHTFDGKQDVDVS